MKAGADQSCDTQLTRSILFRHERGIGACTLGAMPKRRVLIVEDEQDVASLIKHAVERSGDTEADIVGSGDSALKAVAERPPDLVLLDLNLPVLDGVEVCRILRSRPETQRVPIIILTARAGENDRVDGLDLGADDY